MTRKEVEETIEKMLEPIAAAHGVRIYDVDYTKEGGEYSLCCYIDKDGGVTIDDCVDVSHDLSDELDRTDPIKDAYTLYVSSPGLGRALTKDRHFAASIGEEVEGTLFRKLEDGSKAFDGVLKAFDGNTVTIGRTDAKGKELEDLVLDRKNIAKIRLKIDF